MRSLLRSAAPRFLAASIGTLALAAGAAVTAAGSAQAAATGDKPGAQTACGWHKLKLINGWQSAQSSWDTGDPAYCVNSDGIVYLAGGTAQPSPGNTEFAVLPKPARPASTLYISTDTNSGTAGYLKVRTNGQLVAYDGLGNSGQAQQFTSLAGISFPAAKTARAGHALAPLLNNWLSAQSLYQTGNPSYVLKNGVVHLSGSVLNQHGSKHPLFAYLPKAARPTDCFQTNVYTYGGGIGQLQVNSAKGGIWAPDDRFTSLAGLSYPAGQVTWHALATKPAGKSAFCGPPSYTVSRGVVYLTGYWSSPVNSGTVGVLPPSARPAHRLFLVIGGHAAPSNQYSLLQIDPNGTIKAGGDAASHIISLEGISFRVGA